MMIPFGLVSQTMIQSARAIGLVQNMTSEEAALMGGNRNLVFARHQGRVNRLLDIISDSPFPVFSLAKPIINLAYWGILFTLFLPAEPPAGQSNWLSDRIKPIKENISLMAKFIPYILVIHSLALVILTQSIPEVAFLAFFAISLAHSKGYFPDFLKIPYQRLSIFLANFSSLFSKAFAERMLGLSRLVDHTGLLDQKRTPIESHLQDHLNGLTKMGVQTIGGAPFKTLNVSFDHFELDPRIPVYNKTGENILPTFEKFFADHPEKLEPFLSKVVLREDWAKVKEEQPDLEPFVFARKLLSDLLHGIKTSNLPKGQGFDYSNIQHCERVINERLPHADEELQLETFEQLVISTAGFCADGPFHQVPETATNLAFKVKLPGIDIDPASEVNRKIFLKLQEIRYQMALESVQEEIYEKGGGLGRLSAWRNRLLGDKTDIHRNMVQFNDFFSYLGIHHKNEGTDKALLGHGSIINLVYWRAIGKDVIKKIYTQENITYNLLFQKNDIKNELWAWASNHPALLNLYKEEVTAYLPPTVEEGEMDYINWIQFGITHPPDPWLEPASRSIIPEKEAAEDERLKYLLNLFLFSRGVFVKGF